MQDEAAGLLLLFVHIDGIYLKRSQGGIFESIAALITNSVNDKGYHEIIGVA